jgi:single-strand DNA-binding protein
VNAPTISFTGHLGRDPELRFTPNGFAVCDLRVATTPSRKVGDTWVDKETLWFKISCWNELAENVSQSLKKGDRIVVTGRLLQQSYVKADGTPGVTLLVEAVGVGADVKRYPVEIKRTVRAGSSAEVLTDKWQVDPETGEVLGEADPFADDVELEEAAV